MSEFKKVKLCLRSETALFFACALNGIRTYEDDPVEKQLMKERIYS